MNIDFISVWDVDTTNCQGWLIDRMITQIRLTNWALNDDLLIFNDLFYKDLRLDQAAKRFTYQMNKLVKLGISKKAQRIGIGRGSVFEFGVRTQTIWEREDCFFYRFGFTQENDFYHEYEINGPS